VNLGLPPGGLDAMAGFLVEGLGYARVEIDDEMRAMGVNWFEASDGTQVHLSEDPEHHAAARAHVALVVGDELDSLVTRLEASGTKVRLADGLGGGRVGFCRDPAGNRWELRSQ
jgi:uncharacterized glyoxalase superfamily protein PhnB